MTFKTDSEPLNRLQALIRVNAHLMGEDDVMELNKVYKELVDEYHAFENEVQMNEQLLQEIEELKRENKYTTYNSEVKLMRGK